MPSFVDLIEDDEKIIPDILAKRPEPEDHLGATVIVDGCPIVSGTKIDLLKTFLLNRFSKSGPIVSHDFPLDEENKTKGYIFVTYENGKYASQAVRDFNNTPLDKNHTLQVTPLSEYERIVNVPTEYKPPAKQEYKDLGNLKSWLLNEFCRDEFAVIYNDGDVGSVYLHNAVEPTVVEERSRWTDGWMRWSPRGTYLATMHQPGVILWGGEKFLRVGRFPHPGVKTIEYSPMENFIISLSPSSTMSADDQDRQMADVIIWDVRCGVSRREFTVPIECFPPFKWSYNDNYFACLRDGYLVVYDTETFRLLDKKTKQVGDNIRDFSWSPSENILAYWVPETDNTPARVVLMEIPSREELCTKNLFSVAEIVLNWHEQGDFLAIQVLRCAKKKVDNDKQVKYMGTYMNLEVVRLREKLYPVDKLDVKYSISCLHWEPKGTRFAFVRSMAATGKVSVVIYSVLRGGNIRELSVFDIPSCRYNELRWSPNGNLLVVAGLKIADSYLEFFSADDGISLAKGDHPMVSELHWDPTGRFVATVVNSFNQKNDNGIWFWNCIGRCLYKLQLNGLRVFTWRPRPPTLLPPKRLQTLKKSMSHYNTIFTNEDRMLASRANRELLEKRQRLVAEFNAWKHTLLVRYESEKPMRIQLRGKDTDEFSGAAATEEEELEFLVKSVKEIVQKNTEE